MEILRFGRDVYGRETLEGASWDLLWVFAAVGAAIIVVHLLYRWFLAPTAGK
ncbi:MAG: hypothetical protein PVF63_09900 [Gammaproteobacteria bacterium]|jgi:hypothetical protein